MALCALILFSLVVAIHGFAAPNSLGASCFIFGDSIAQGIAARIPRCASNTKIGLTTKAALQRLMQREHTALATELAVISLGVNDHDFSTRANLEVIRSQIGARQFIWILPPNPAKKEIVLDIADANGDQVIEIDRLTSQDGIHPSIKGYQLIADALVLSIRK